MLGGGVSVWPGTVIRGDANSRVGAGSLVPERRVLASGWLDLGHPACLMRRLTAEEVAHSVCQAGRLSATCPRFAAPNRFALP